MVDRFLVQPQRAGTARDESSCRLRIATRKEGYVMVSANQFFCEVRDDPLGSTVAFRRDTFMKGSNLGNAHVEQLRI